MEKYYLFHYQLHKTLESVLQFLPKNAKRQVNELLIVRDVIIKISKKGIQNMEILSKNQMVLFKSQLIKHLILTVF